MNKKRLYHFDVLKGMAIFAVVMGHVLTMCVRDLDRAFLFKFIGQIHMPLFFFISGWFSIKAVDGKLKAPDFVSRALQLLVPMVVVSSLWIYYFPRTGLQSPFDSTWSGLWGSEGKNGYWFTPVLFEIIAIQGLLLRPVWNVLRGFGGRLLALVSLSALLMAGAAAIPTTWAGALSFVPVATYFPVFAFGGLCRLERESFERQIASTTTQTVAILLGAVTFYVVSWYWEFPSIISDLLPAWCALLHICIAVVAIGAVAPWCARVFTDEGCTSAWARMWCLLGRESLAIYLLHYFLLFPMGGWRPLLESTHLALVPLALFCAFWAAIIISVVLGIRRIIALSAPLNLLLTGQKK